ncbi:hypothetical protein HK405_005214, partial [Cladochytrium tenue]
MDVTSKQLSIECTINVLSVIYLVQAVVCVGKVPKDGRIVNMSSSASKLLAPSLIEADGVTQRPVNWLNCAYARRRPAPVRLRMSSTRGSACISVAATRLQLYKLDQ